MLRYQTILNFCGMFVISLSVIIIDSIIIAKLYKTTRDYICSIS